MLLEPGRFRTNLLSKGNVHAVETKIDDYMEASEIHNGHLRDADMKQDGDPKKFVKLSIDLVREEGAAAGKVVPFRMIMGKDSVDEISEKLDETIRGIKEWKDVAENMGFDE